MSEVEKHLKAQRMFRVASIMYLVAAVSFMILGIYESRNGRSGAVWISLGAVFIALGSSAGMLRGAFAKKAKDSAKADAQQS